MPRFGEILCPVDFSDTSRHAVELASVVASWHAAHLTALFVYTPLYVPMGAMPVTDVGLIDEAELARIRADLEAILQPVRASGLLADSMIREAAPAAGILDAARILNADLIVMGTHGAGGFERLLLGSVAEKVLRKAPCPVLTVPPRAESTARAPFARIVCAVDFAPTARAALAYAAALARESHASLTLLHVLDWPDEEPVSYRAFDIPEYKRQRGHEAKQQLEALAPVGMDVGIRLVHGKPHREITAIAQEESADLLVMGAGGERPLALFGSTVAQVVRTARCPVLTVRT